MPGWSVQVDRTRCLGCGVCAAYAPGSFTQDDEGLAVLCDPPADPVEQVRTAVDSCPTGALSLAITDIATDDREG
ncbi:ferredoxin [Nocardia speluncae]|uniref:Ferredoxin n=1 Tax=Nocardia speluncae TaxID=419477 RepID=A0A846XF46_9NOCA|nr:ferredoxin [Nocardia speluncae]NKY33243.1 ferredoxin [Nocardia speluncae]